MRPTAVLRLVVAAGLACAHGVRATPTEEVEIVWQDAQRAGAAFPDPALADASAGCRATTGVARSGGILLSLCCPGTLGTKSVHTALAAFRLRNGWRVRDTRVVVVAQSRAGFDLEKPVPGSDDPFLKGTLWAGPGGEVLLEVYVKVVGPKGTRYFR